jgi:photosystem II stability/assembly factor-like uncharacterized protein
MSQREKLSGSPEGKAPKGKSFITLQQRTPAGGVKRDDLWDHSLEDLNNLLIIGEREWVPIGPQPLITAEPVVLDGIPIKVNKNFQGKGPDSGEITDIAIDPSGTTDQIIYIAAGSGGIWKTTDGGQHWAPKGDMLRTLSMGAVALDPTNHEVVYAGTGNLFDPGGVFAKGVGIYKSIDGGETWAQIDGGVFATIFANSGINRILALASNVLMVATNNGLFRSIDGGLNFGANPDYNNGLPILHGEISSLTRDTLDPDIVYAGAAGSGVIRLKDQGATFDKNLFTGEFLPEFRGIFAGLPTALRGPFGRIAFAQSRLNQAGQPDNKIMFASVQRGPAGPTDPTAGSKAEYIGLFKSEDGGQEWVEMKEAKDRINSAGADQTADNLTIGVDPQNSQTIYLCSKELWCSIDGGSSFLAFNSGDPISSTQIHVDHHALAFTPESHISTKPTRVYVGTDGGFATCKILGGGVWDNLNNGIGTNLVQAIAIGRGAGGRDFTYCAMQDTGTAGRHPGDTNLEWHETLGGDSESVAIDPADAQIVYGFTDEIFAKSVDGGRLWATSQRDGGRPAFIPIRDASPDSPIMITSKSDHPFLTGDQVELREVQGNTAANGLWVITRKDHRQFSLNGSIGTPGSVGSGGFASGPKVTIKDASPTSPIVITTDLDHFYFNEDEVVVGGVAGNTAANGTWRITIKDQDRKRFSLNGSKGIPGTVSSGGSVTGPAVGRALINLKKPLLRCVALEQNNRDTHTRVVYLSEANLLRKSTDAGITFTVVRPFDEHVTALATTILDSDRLWVGLIDGTVHYSADGGTTWDVDPFKVSPGGVGAVDEIAVDPTNVERVAIVYSGQRGGNPQFRTRRCFLTSDNGETWNDVSGTDGAGPSKNLPDIPLHSVVWDTSTTPPSLIVASDAGVMRSTDLGASWHVLGPNLPTVCCQSLAIDNSVSPPVLRVGTYGRSCFELRKSAGRHLVVRSNLAFGTVAAGQSPVLPMQLFNVGDADLEIITVGFLSGSNLLEMTPPLPVPFTLHVNEMRACLVRFTPAGTGNHTATFIVISNDDVQTLREVQASGSSIVAASAPRLAVDANLTFGRVSMVIDRTLPIQVSNTGLGPLIIKKISRTGGSTDFELVSPPTFPLPPLQPGEKRDLTVRFKPSSAGPLDATFEIESDDLISRDGKPAGTRTIKATGVGKSKAGNHLAKVLIALGIIVALGATALVVKDLED